MTTKNILWLGVILLIIVLGGFYFLNSGEEADYNKQEVPTPITEVINTDAGEVTETPDTAINNPEPMTIIGLSAGENSIAAYHFGTGEQELLFIGGIHGGYSWNTALLSFELIDWLKANENKIPANIKVTVVPVLNPDGLKKVTGTTGRFTSADVNKTESVRVSGRFNENNVDLNRNFACDWKAVGTWQNRSVSGGTAAFSEPESQAIKAYVERNEPTAVVTWYSAAGGVYASKCGSETGKDTAALTDLFAKASKYKAYAEFDNYEINGDMVNWLAGQKISAISILLTNHEQTEFAKNLAGVEAVINYYAN
ncbi:MAG TPA: M14 family metallopeptidase [Candidatus Paceibacterota bacterium]|nr:M14 family metallopeptidase [Candidatus Paceibacterota bacterium]HMO82643.1 M14 family metallopeptidase [Candidatus Paceibacterota bacterium]